LVFLSHKIIINTPEKKGIILNTAKTARDKEAKTARAKNRGKKWVKIKEKNN